MNMDDQAIQRDVLDQRGGELSPELWMARKILQDARERVAHEFGVKCPMWFFLYHAERHLGRQKEAIPRDIVRPKPLPWWTRLFGVSR